MKRNRTVYKYPVTAEALAADGGVFSIDLPETSEILHFAQQGEDFCIWVLVDTSEKSYPTKFVLVGTGHPIPDGDLTFVGSTLVENGAFVFHLFAIQP